MVLRLEGEEAKLPYAAVIEAGMVSEVGGAAAGASQLAANSTRAHVRIAQVGAGWAKFAVVGRIVESGVGGIISDVSPGSARIARCLARRSHVLAKPLR